jgi:SAM-dependent methyltransferase
LREATLQALDMRGLGREAALAVADLGCGTGASTLALAAALPRARFTAVDFLQPFIDELDSSADRAGVADRITPLCASMDDLPLADAAFDLVWSEGAVYNIGFDAGTRAWRRLLKPGGVLVASELTWLTERRPSALQAHWDAEYPEVDRVSAKIRVLERNGYSPLGHFVLPSRAWQASYYGPMQARFEAFLERHGHSDEARAVVDAERKEIALYEQYHPFVGYGVYVAQRVEG